MSIERVLIVDDDEDVRQVCEIAARRLGKWEVLLASGGEEALEQARAMRPDVILLDVMMPRVDGPTTLGMLRDDPSTPTGKRVAYDARALPANGEGVHLDARLFDALDGFSPGPIGTLHWPQGVDLAASVVPPPTDLAASLVRMVSWNIAHIARLVASQEGARTIIFTGSFMHDNAVSQVCL